MNPDRLGPFTLDYLKEETSRFREVMCSTNFSDEQKTRGFQALFLVAVNVESAAQEAAQFIWEMTASEYAQRRTLEIMKPLFRMRTQ